MKPEPISIVIADDHPLFRHGLCQAIEPHKEFIVVAEAGDGEQALAAILHHSPRIAILDMHMPKLSGMDVLKELNKRDSSTDVIVLTMHNEEDIVHRAIDLGVMGYVLKESAVKDILECLHAVAGGRQYISPTIAGYLIKRTQPARAIDAAGKIADLTPMQYKVLRLIAENKTTKEIADLLYISPRTVERHRANICDKLSISGNNALLRFVLENKSLL